MKKIVKRYGGSFVIQLTPDEIQIYDLAEGDFVDVEIVKEKSKVGWDVK